MRTYLEAKKKEQEARLKKFKTSPEEILAIDSSTDEEIKNCEDNLKIIEPNLKKNSEAQKRSFKVKRICHFLDLSLGLLWQFLCLFQT